jgi:hypothetical protein
VLLTAAAVSALADFTIAEAAALHSSPPDLVSSTLVLRGATDPTEQNAAASDGAALTVLRGSPPSAAQPRLTPYACPPGLDYDGCVLPGYVYAPDYGSPDYGYWPDYGFGEVDTGRGRHGFAHGIARGRAFRFGHAFAHNGLGHAFGHAAGFGHR